MTAEPAGATEQDGIDAELGWALHTVHAAYVRRATDAVARVPGGPRGYQVLLAATTEPPASQHALGRRLLIDKNGMTAVVDALESHGLVERRPDPDDRRVRRIVATGPGRDLLRQTRAAVRDAEEDLLQGLSGTERAQLRVLLAQAAGALERIASCS